METVLAKFQETQRMQEEQYLGFREELRTISSAFGTIVGVLKEILNTRRDTVALQGAPDTSMDDELPTTSAGTSGQEAPPQDHHTSTPPPADREPPCKRSQRSRNKTEHDAKTPPRNETTLIVKPLSHFVTLSILELPSSTSYAHMGNAPVRLIDWTLPWTFLTITPHHFTTPLQY
ncbi:hypothetical protein NDU88_007536 [Pleurodeles waltl]|uniref:Uncharacterized protein n=1 Tax=Pleurodeles waltl TaxID=8319 RepID=A0AAV7VSW9_PLEWA|nr:hypothetical protein NDU88_007536 [Pleurodeles waltl]